MPRMLPNFIIIGAPRSGTTALSQYLSGHPQVFVSAQKELFFFDRRFDRGLDWYTNHFVGAEGKSAVGEASPRYMYIEEAMARMARVIPQAKLIAILRHPVDRAYSYYWHRRAYGHERREFTDIVAAELAAWHGGAPVEPLFLEGGRYRKYLSMVCRYFPREGLQVLIFEELRAAPRPTFAAVCRFLGVDETSVPADLGRVFNPYEEFRSSALRKLGARLPRFVRRRIRGLNVRRKSYPPMDPTLRQALHAQFAGENTALAAWLGRDLSIWSGRGS